MKKRGLLLDDTDSVVVVLDAIEAEDTVEYVSSGGVTGTLIASQAIPVFHKIARLHIKKGVKIIKYGESIGRATDEIVLGSHVHEHNLD